MAAGSIPTHEITQVDLTGQRDFVDDPSAYLTISVILYSTVHDSSSIDLNTIQYNPDLNSCYKNTLTLGYDPGVFRMSISLIGNKVLARVHPLTLVTVASRPTCAGSNQTLRTYRLTYAQDPDTTQLRLSNVRMTGREGTPEAGISVPIASNSYGTASSEGKLTYQSQPQISLSNAYPIGMTEVDAFIHPLGATGYSTNRSLTDVTGDGRADLVQAGIVSRNTATGPGGSTRLGEGGNASLGMTPLEIRGSPGLRYDAHESAINDDLVWRQAIDFDGDGRVDIVDAMGEARAWAVYLNTPDPANPRNIVWQRRTYSTAALAQHLRERGLWSNDDWIPLALRSTTRDYVYSACIRWNGASHQWLRFEDDGSVVNGSCPPGGTLLSVGLESTITAWELKDLNGDGYPDVVLNSSPIVTVNHLNTNFPPPNPPNTIPIPTTRTVSPQLAAGDANTIDAMFNIAGAHLGVADHLFAAPVTIRSGAGCGVTRWVATDGSHQQLACSLVDVNGDGVADLVSGTSVFLGTGSRGTGVFFTPGAMMTLPGSLAIQSNNHAAICVPPNTGATTFGVDQQAGLRDLTGDGIPDYVSQSGISWRVAVGTGTDFTAAIPITGIFAFSSETEDCAGAQSKTDFGLYDLDGDGSADVVSSGPGTPGVVSVQRLVGSGGVPGAPEAGRLVQVDNGYGAQTKITYRSAKEDPTTLHQVPFPEIVVTSVETTATQGLGGALSATQYAYGAADLVFDPALDAFTFPGYRRMVQLQIADAQKAQGVATITDAYGPATRTDPYGLMLPGGGCCAALTVDQRYNLYQRAGRTSDVTVLSGSVGADAWALLATNVTSDARRIAATHYDWGTRLLAASSDPAGPETCREMVLPYDHVASLSYASSHGTYDVCTAHGFAFAQSVQSWRGDPGAAPPSTANVAIRSDVQTIDAFGRILRVFHAGDVNRNDDDVCVDTTYAEPAGTNERVLFAAASRRVSDCGAVTYARDTWEYDQLAAGNVSSGFPTSHSVERHDDLGGLLGTVREFDTTFDTLGNPLTVTMTRDDDGVTRTATVDYDPFRLVPAVITLTATGVPATQIVVTHDPVTLNALTTTDPNGTLHGTTFDGFGRPVLSTMTPPGGSVGALAATSFVGFAIGEPPGRSITQKVFTDPVDPAAVSTAPGRTGTVYLDELGRAMRTELALGADYGNQKLVVGRRTYDNLGRVVFEADPFPSTQDFATAYGTTRLFNVDGTPSCVVRGNGPQPFTGNGSQPSTWVTDELHEIYPTCFQHAFESNTEVVSVKDPASLLAGSPQDGVMTTSYATAVGRTIARSTWQGATRLEHATFTHDRLGHQTGMTRYRDAVAGANPVTSSWHFDSLGQVVELDEPDSVPQLNTYSSWGELLRVRRYMDPGSGGSGGSGSGSGSGSGGGDGPGGPGGGDGPGGPGGGGDGPPSLSLDTGTNTVDMIKRYDALERVIHSEQHNNGIAEPATVNDYLYDQAIKIAPQVTPTNMLGRLAQAISPTGAVSFNYDAFGQINARVFTDLQGGMYVETHTSHGDGSPAALDLFLPDTGYADEHVDYLYDSAGRGRSVRYNNGPDREDLLEVSTLDPFGRVRDAHYGPASYIASYADVGRRLLNQVDVSSALGSRSISYQGYDPVGRERSRTEVKDGTGPVNRFAYDYDALGRLSSAVKTTGHTTVLNQLYTYDALGNVLGLSSGSGIPGAMSTTLTYLDSDRDRICRIAYGADSGTACNVTYDPVGNIVQQPTRTGVRQLSFFADGSVRSVTDGTSAAQFRYDAFGEVQELDLTSSTSADTRHDRRYGGLIAWRDETVGSSTTSVLNRTIPGPDGFQATRHGAGGPWVFAYGEARGNRFFTDDTGAFVQDVDYEPYGKATSTGAPPGSSHYSNEQWNGGDALAALGLSHLGARLYDPAIGRFLSRDPLLIPRTAATTNPYAFANNDPVNHSDPSGLDSDTIDDKGPLRKSEPGFNAIAGAVGTAGSVSGHEGSGPQPGYSVGVANNGVTPAFNASIAAVQIRLAADAGLRAAARGTTASYITSQVGGGLYDVAKGVDHLAQWGANMFDDLAHGDIHALIEDLGEPGRNLQHFTAHPVDTICANGCLRGGITFGVTTLGGGIAGRLSAGAGGLSSIEVGGLEGISIPARQLAPVELESDVRVLTNAELCSVCAGAGPRRILQTGGHTINQSTTRALNETFGVVIERRQWGRYIERIKQNLGLRPDFHGAIDSAGNYLDPGTKEVLGSLSEFLP